MKHLYKIAAKYKMLVICGPLFKLLEVCFELCVPLVMKRIIDVGIDAGSTSYIVKMAGILVLLGVLGLASTVTAQYFSAKAAVNIVSEIKQKLFSKIQSLSFADVDNLQTSSMITRMTSDANQVQSGVNLTLRLLLRSPFVVFGSMIAAFTIDSRAALIFVVVIPLLAAVVLGISICCIPLYKKVQSRLDSVLNLTRENIKGIRVIRAFGREEAEKRQFIEYTADLYDGQMLVGKISAFMNPVTYILINFAVIALIYIGAVRVNTGNLTTGAVVSLYNYMLLILVELIKLANLIITMTKSVACEHRIEAVLDYNTVMQNGTVKQEPKSGLVEFDNASIAYHEGAENALEGISFTTASGRTVGIIGGTGSGKSTLVNLIPRFYDVIGGSVRIDGIDVRDYDIDSLRSAIAVVPQKSVLFSGTIRENLLWGDKNADDAAINEALKVSQSEEFVNAKPEGLETQVGQGGRNLSGGQRQRLCIARALVKRPKILILDDSSSALDFATDAALRKALRTLSYNPTVFVVSQRTSSVMYADKIIVLHDGAAVGTGTHEELLQSCEIYREIYESQFGAEVRNEKE